MKSCGVDILGMPVEFLISPWGGIFWLMAVTIALTFHEFLHALVAYSLGDQTPKSEGRVTPFPFPHIDPLGFVLLLLFGFGWAKPVRFEPANLRYQTFGPTLVALAGPLANALLLIVTIALAQLLRGLTAGPLSVNAQIFFASLIVANSLLLVVNLIPLPPFDGSKFLLDLLRMLRLNGAYEFLIKNGRYLLVGLLLIDALSGLGIIGRLLSFVTKWAATYIN
ncbi:MAG: site-2 protease family protein [Patescibacteria group bacterium]